MTFILRFLQVLIAASSLNFFALAFSIADCTSSGTILCTKPCSDTFILCSGMRTGTEMNTAPGTVCDNGVLVWPNSCTIAASSSPTISSTTNLTSTSILPQTPIADTLPETKYFTMNITQKIINTDGVDKLMLVANNQLDYTIEVNKGDQVIVRVNNQLNVSTSIHWHGMYQVDTPWMDGAGMVTQCLIKSGGSMVYNFSTSDQVGTYWWHAHYASQYTDGLRGPFIVHDPQDPYTSQYDEEIIMTVTDFFHKNASTVLEEYLGRRCNCAVCTQIKLLTFLTTDRVRVINTSAQANFDISIDNHTLTMIEQDGIYTNPTVISSFKIATAQRYSFIVTANSTVGNFWIRAIMMDMYTPTGTEITNGLNFETLAIWRYQGAPEKLPTSVQEDDKPLDPYTLGELNGLTPSTLPNWDTYIYFQYLVGTANMITVQSDTTNFYANQYFMPMAVPDLETALQGSQLHESSNPFPLNNSWVLLQIRNWDNIEHLFHLHGHSFYVLQHGKLLHRRDRRGYGFSNTLLTYPRRDSVVVPMCTGGAGGGGEAGCTAGYVNILIHFNHPGVWLFHCHVEWHMATGLAMTFVNEEGMDKVRKTIPKDWFDTCQTM
ncbi:hypothetical protein BCR33DRAFT_724102 [Rhizoclosmatium globosum]|uniref:Multicopper oxidase n=1 Tax=Rhizoclosmatium globosum TaxID=329046 RepID=A0A1Y2B8K0_9FUNG|nr:hypothetical protein BCR33DRAFT_724102 [Rhizoclosmatium globosum]|eukprot:ORY31171.1 hypothetical protein BCR33DRAFT_724102 [Rhizoclosmatium globosum]